MKHVYYLIDGESVRYSNLSEVRLHLSLMSPRDLAYYDGALILRVTSDCVSCTHEIVTYNKTLILKPLRRTRLA